jgi:hypothetical protein
MLAAPVVLGLLKNHGSRPSARGALSLPALLNHASDPPCQELARHCQRHHCQRQ